MTATLTIDIPAGEDFLSREELDSLTPAILRQRLEALKPLIAERARSVEENRRPDPEVWAALRKTGVFYMFIPKALGGLEMTFEDLVDVILPVAEACASTAWATCFSIEHNLMFLRAFPAETVRRVYEKTPYIIAPGAQSPPATVRPVEGGYVIDAHWKWGSGVMNSDWVMGSGLLHKEDGPPETLLMLLPSRDVTVLDAWYMQGMAGTGSNDMVVKDYFIPDECVSSGPRGAGGVGPIEPEFASPLTDIPFNTVVALTTMLPALGAAREAVTLFQGRLEGRKVTGTSRAYRDREAQHIRLGKAETLVGAAEVLVRQASQAMWEAARAGSTGLEVRTPIRSRIMYALELCREAVSSLVLASGASVHALDCPMQRYLRDIHVISNHGLYDADLVYEQRGRILLGFEPSDIFS
ncbi:Acyl-CoA dehydrogenase [Prauserella aidingensis]|uniref:acyl-CoA dehydrogenase family protein n=1 Tax=Prauserella aidingensis TaxID=387890 RepID=UPI0020A4C165|nr:acyl-CoA dehydrogenase family protein [Prauserella aidingensis]MCP2256019.1 Acyl-CoA dehydrogenase [Prauserella aidingensis]